MARAVPKWQQLYTFYRVQKDLPEEQAALQATNDINDILNKTVEEKKGVFNIFSSANPVNTSEIFKRYDLKDKEGEYAIYREKKAKGEDFIRNGFENHGTSQFLAKEGGIIPGTGGADGDLANAIKYLQGKGPLPKIYIELAEEFPGLTGDKLARWQVSAALASGQFADADINVDELLESKNINSAAYDALNLPQHSEVGKLLGFKSSPFSHCQAKACINDQLAAIRSGDKDLKTTPFKTDDQVTEDSGDDQVIEDSGDAKLLEGGHVQPKDEDKQSTTEKAVENLEGDLVLEESASQDIDYLQSKELDIKDDGRDIDQEILNKYFGGGITYPTGGDSNSLARLKYLYAIRLLGDNTPREGDRPHISDRIWKGVSKKINEVLQEKREPGSVQSLNPLTGDYASDMNLPWVKQKIESGEWQLIPILDGKEIKPEEVITDKDVEGQYDIFPSMYQGYAPSKLVPKTPPKYDYRIIYPNNEPTNNLQSSLNVPGSPYLAENLQGYAGQLIAFHVGTDPTIPLTLDEATDDNTRWNWVVDQARKSGSKYPELIAAQFMLESGRGANVSGTHNYFGLKTTATDPESTWLLTSEFKNGKWVKVMAPFKNFDSPEAAIKYLSRLWYKDFGAYKGANNAQDINGAIQVLVNGGYATDPKYTEKLLKILTEFEKIKSKPKQTITA